MSNPRRRAAKLAVAIAGFSVVATSATAGAEGGANPADSLQTGRVVVMVDPPRDVGKGGPGDPSTPAGERTARRRIASILDRNDLQAADRLPEIGAVTVEPAPGESVAELEERLAGEPGVVRVEPEYRRELRYTPTDPGFRSFDQYSYVRQWYLINQGFERAWDHSRGAGVIVAVIDTGVDGSHGDLGPRISFAEDRDANHSTPATYDDYGHGTHVAGLACGIGGNGYGIVGAGHSCNIGVEKTDLTDTSINGAIISAVNHGAKVINMSFGGGSDPGAMCNAVNYAWAYDVLMVAAADNSSTNNQGYPAKCLVNGNGSTLGAGKGLVVTGAYANGANAATGYGAGISMAAYGFSASNLPGVFSTYPYNQTELDTGGGVFGEPPCNCRRTFGSSSNWAYLQGTSMAAPQVAGAAALIRSIKPALKASEVITILERDASGSSFNGTSSGLGWGILNAGEAVANAAGGAKCTKNYKKKKRRFWRSHKSKKQRKKWKRTHIRC